MIFIVVKFKTKPEFTAQWPEIVADFTAATRAEEGNLWFEWSRSLDDPSTYVLVEAFQDGAAEAHVNAPHFAAGLTAMQPALAETPKIISRQLDGAGWDSMGELRVDTVGAGL
ncbi:MULTISPECIES: putative quinol monooxygenase [Arthrobacter]|uniref:Quinol monooxygenase YgiN n=2 Tax=Arthrobacter TaxID=1663 RepID=A0AAW8DDC1_9MICC|nr:putative quinol monooxygenase [Arthrobacter bambusae]MDP9906337.1 quinol monooxygenase YgiN [Arthrobacter bambusae]MDQ0129080.1 quinol monooxygenase YgiN [Arthrobacter bambusae]MDQ0180574.1 quinol monooxygenase YgiN [Arthrobacter bambusae]MDQ0239923.1 quinol monooxygenase YgiN [Arthrobacter bambusae]